MSSTVLRVCIWICGILALFGNILVIYWRVQDKWDCKVRAELEIMGV